MWNRLRFAYFAAAIALAGGVLGYFIAKGEWQEHFFWFAPLAFSIGGMWSAFGPGVAERRAARKAEDRRDRELEREYEHQERWRPGSGW